MILTYTESTAIAHRFSHVFLAIISIMLIPHKIRNDTLRLVVNGALS